MQGAQTQMIDGYRVLLGFRLRQIDPESTKIEARRKLEATPQWVEFITSVQKLETLRLDAVRSNCRGVQVEELRAVERATSEKYEVVQKLKKTFLNGTVVYFGCRAGEVELTDKEHERLKRRFDMLPPYTQLTIEGDFIPDYRGSTFWLKEGQWTRVTIDKLGEIIPDRARLIENLTAAERFEVERLIERELSALMTAEQRDKVREEKVINLDREAVKLRSLFEIQGEADPLGRVQSWYQDQIKRIDEIYSR